MIGVVCSCESKGKNCFPWRSCFVGWGAGCGGGGGGGAGGEEDKCCGGRRVPLCKFILCDDARALSVCHSGNLNQSFFSSYSVSLILSGVCVCVCVCVCARARARAERERERERSIFALFNFFFIWLFVYQICALFIVYTL